MRNNFDELSLNRLLDQIESEVAEGDADSSSLNDLLDQIEAEVTGGDSNLDKLLCKIENETTGQEPEYSDSEESDRLDSLLDQIEAEISEEGQKAEEKKAEARPIWVAYIDGSYNRRKNRYGYGVVILEAGEIIRREYGGGMPLPSENGWNINGELAAAECAIQLALDNNCKELVIFHDYAGVGKWADHHWNTTKDYVREYISFVEKARETVKISFVHVKGHSGVKYNEMADDLAKTGAEKE